ncbi:hypothetical protein UFOVP1204_12 [uncultured Caudovirales phage]|uniref:Uncharacterized protein n=1 Tax=uncultured Caudovirales phage TaxID=2100421 RepID=A0A6J5PYV2_9CAUD|nr:hypothetical protein UFOVP473_15 [uncultured Caudovirales phage]CAB4176302.1 hypothetical protein UFOVP983_15 [uncultured Caudovirales phage]CAB4189526.1 hypothetical protein UFOVP1204_12 [uncultured Caudovirales phage]
MRPVRVSVGPLATAGTTKVCTSQTPLAAGNLTINGTAASGGVATLDTYRRVLLTFAADESARTFVVYGTGRDGTQYETVAGAASSAYTALDYLTVTRISIDAASAGAITVGTNGIASSAWVPLDVNGPPQLSLQVDLSGTINATVQQTLNDVWTPTAKPADYWVNHADSNLVAMTSGHIQGNYAYVPAATRLTLNSGTGSAVFTVVQPGPSYL